MNKKDTTSTSSTIKKESVEVTREIPKLDDIMSTDNMLNELDNTTEVLDDGDLASALELTYIKNALIRHKQNTAPEKHPDFDGVNCIECEEPIHKERLLLAKIRCIDCQKLFDKKEKNNRLLGR